eukprot:584314-Prymnesium_polylepis.2
MGMAPWQAWMRRAENQRRGTSGRAKAAALGVCLPTDDEPGSGCEASSSRRSWTLVWQLELHPAGAWCGVARGWASLARFAMSSLTVDSWEYIDPASEQAVCGPKNTRCSGGFSRGIHAWCELPISAIAACSASDSLVEASCATPTRAVPRLRKAATAAQCSASRKSAARTRTTWHTYARAVFRPLSTQGVPAFAGSERSASLGRIDRDEVAT